MKRSHLAAGLTAVVVAATAAVPVSAAPQEQEVRADGLTTKVTLITGDEVTVSNGKVHARAAQGRETVGFRSFKDPRGDLHVVPLDAQHRLNTGELDARLFDVSLLARSGYDDASSKTLPLIVQGQGISAANAESLPSIDARAIEVGKNGSFWAGVRAAGTGRIWLDGKVTASLDRSAAQVGAPQAWEKGFTGKDVTVAILDTGVDETHPDLAGAVVESKNFSDSDSTDDRLGHGTHVASTVTGDGKYKGIAPDAKLINGKVLGDYGGGRESDIIAGMEWAAAKAKVVNMSLGSSWPDEGTDPMSLALNQITAQTGALFVVAAGNSGGAIGSPGSADAALTVGAVNRDDTLAEFSSRGPRWVNNAVKPDITAPGVDIVAAKAKNGQIGTPVDEGHVSMSGTSMATPHVAGAAAILASKNPAWKAEDIKAALMNSAKPNPSLSIYEQGAGRLDVGRAVSAGVSTNHGSFSLGTAVWPHDDDKPITQKLTYRNNGASDVTVDLSVAEVKPAGAGLFSVSPAKLTIPAGGTADATVTADTKAAVADGVYGAVVLSSDGVRVPIGVVKEVESYDVKLTFLDHNGKPTPSYDYRFVSLDQPQAYFRFDPSGTLVQRLPKGKFFLDGTINTRDPDPTKGGLTTTLTEPALEVTGNTEVVFDARQGTQPVIAVEQKDAKAAQAGLGFLMQANWGATGGTWYLNSFDSIRVRPSKTSWPKFEFYAETVQAKPDANGKFDGSPYQYHVRISEKTRVPENLQRSVKDRELAKVDSITHARVPGSIGQRDNGASGPLPLRLKEFYTPGVDWSGGLTEFTKLGEWPALGSQYSVAPRVFKLGRTTTEHWNSAVYGPGVPHAPGTVRFAGRVGNLLRLDLPVHGSQGMYGYSSPTTGRTTITLDGKVISDQPEAGYGNVPDAPAEKKRYTVHTEATRDSFSSKVTADWSFYSEFVAGDMYKSVPLLAVRFAPQLDANNRAGRVVTVPITVERNGTGPVTNIKDPAVQVSYDEGKTWKPVPLRKTRAGWQVTLIHPHGAKNVSFKARAADAGGDVQQTIIRAYDLK
ncbi:S8 family serine peptidase [Lentzea sp. NBC_00516]|uniref:S8 family serine peptidase n=1 Tax=Lentzea sp. NBC_00516 TaxID=2903582 RepID=UPI002E80A8DB|nr:S8 family serine peptidase [Lentzea sp. NBC_00516]WUD27093.1 S8 family serine peptidase [Lentzea sp. NBC_00516]